MLAVFAPLAVHLYRRKANGRAAPDTRHRPPGGVILIPNERWQEPRRALPRTA